LSKIYGDLMGFLFTWSAALVLKPGSAAIISIIFGEYVVRAIVGAEASDLSVWLNKGVAIMGLISVVVINCISTRLGTRMGDIFMLMKFVALLGVTAIGIIVAITGFSYKNANIAKEWKHEDWFENTSPNLSNWAVALYAGLWAYDGWDNTNYVVGEFRNPSKDLPRVLHTAMPLVILCYLLANLSYIFVLPTTIIASTNTIAVQFGSAVFGPVGALILAITVSLSCFGALNATTFTSGRLVYAGGKEGYLPSFLGKIGFNNDGFGGSGVGRGVVRSGLWGRFIDLIGDEDGAIGYTPINAMVFNGVLTAVYVAVGEFGTLVTFYGVAGYSFYFLTVLGLIILRVREPDLERPYRTWITTPVIFCCVSLFLLTRAVVAQPLQTLLVLGFVVAGIPMYMWRVSGRGGRKDRIKWKFWKRWTG
jgi:amino acid transporter